MELKIIIPIVVKCGATLKLESEVRLCDARLAVSARVLSRLLQT